jgi:DNA adenine methylase
VQPTSPAAPWIGGKRNLAARLVEIIEAIPHRCYAEPFVGMGGVFFRRSTRPKAEVINDFNRDVANFFRILQVHFVPFVEMMRYQLTTRAEFERLSQVKPDTLTDLQRAARFLYLQRTGFGGKVQGRVFGTDPGASSRFDVTKLVPMLEELHGRLAGVVIECLSYADFIERYDRPETLFYLDPPYWGTESYYGKELFSREDFARLAEQLAGIKGRFVLSINDVPEIRQIFGRFARRKVKTTYTARGGHGKPAAELIITGP